MIPKDIVISRIPDALSSSTISAANSVLVAGRILATIYLYKFYKHAVGILHNVLGTSSPCALSWPGLCVGAVKCCFFVILFCSRGTEQTVDPWTAQIVKNAERTKGCKMRIQHRGRISEVFLRC